MTEGIAEVLPEESLNEFLATMRDFDQRFVNALVSGVDFTIKLEVRGNDTGNFLYTQVAYISE